MARNVRRSSTRGSLRRGGGGDVGVRGLKARRSTNLKRAQNRAIKRQGLNKIRGDIKRSVRPAVRPAAPPQRVMPKRPSPAQASRPRTVKPSRSAPVRRASSSPRQTKAEMIAAAFALDAGAAHTDLALEVTSLQHSLSRLEALSSFENLRTEVESLEKDLNHAVELLESAREKGFRYQGDLDEIAHQAMSQWQQIRSQVFDRIQKKADAFENELLPLGKQMKQLNANLTNPRTATNLLRATQTQVNDLLTDVRKLQSDIEDKYSDIESKTYTLNSHLSKIHWSLNQLEESRFELEDGEDLVLAVPARWDQEGEDDPEGVLFLSSKRLAFEQKEKVATKKILFITTASELVQEILFQESIDDVEAVKAANKGLFGHQDFLEVAFMKGKLGTISFHLDGQDSKDWANLVERVRSGSIEEERISGSGLSFSDLRGEVTQADIVAVQNEVNELQDELMLKEVRADLEALENNVSLLERKLKGVRARGYAIESHLEGEVAILKEQWGRVKANANSTLSLQTELLGDERKSLQDKMSELAGISGNLNAARPKYMALKSSIASAEAQAIAAEETVLSQYDDYKEEVEGLAAHLEWIDWMLDAIATTSFQLMATESGVAAVEAIWNAPGREPENGILFLTDQRILWEDRVGENELKIDVPLQNITEVKMEVGEEGSELLAFFFTGAAPFANTRFVLSAPVADEWLKMVGRARSGDYVRDRAIEIDQTELDKVKNAPTVCSNCAAAFTAPILRGQTEITCEYCGTVTRL